MRKVVIIGLLLVSTVVKAASVTATVEAYNKALLSGDVPTAAAVSFANTCTSKGQVTKGATAEMVISGLPQSTINSIVLYVYSNTSSGAATITMSLGKNTWQVASGNYNTWPGMSSYSTSALPLVCLSSKQKIAKGTSLTVTIEGMANSVYLSHMVVDYTIVPPVPHTVTLQWPSNRGLQRYAIQEDVAGEGMLLPSVDTRDSVVYHMGDKWCWAGWTEAATESTSPSPLYWQRDDWYVPEKDTTLYALYTNAPNQTVQQDSSFVSGEYAMAFGVGSSVMLASGGWCNGRLTLTAFPFVQETGGLLIGPLTCLADPYRYQLTFTPDSVSIYHPQSKSWIGYAKSAGCNTPLNWAWRKSADGSICIYSHQLVAAKTQYANISILYDDKTATFYAAYSEDFYENEYPYWRLFPTKYIPSPTQIVFSTLPTWTADCVVSVDPSIPFVCKQMDERGRIVVRVNQQQFTILGQPL